MQNRNIFRWIAAVIITLLAAYLRLTGYLPENWQEAAYEDQTAQESEYGTAPEDQSAEESEHDEYEAGSEPHTAEQGEQVQGGAQTRDGQVVCGYMIPVFRTENR